MKNCSLTVFDCGLCWKGSAYCGLRVLMRIICRCDMMYNRLVLFWIVHFVLIVVHSSSTTSAVSGARHLFMYKHDGLQLDSFLIYPL